MKTQRIVEILKSGAVDTDVVVKGWVRTKRGNKNVAFIALNDGSCVGNIQVVVDLAKISEEELKPVTTGACIRVDGRLFGSVTNADIAEAVDKLGFQIKKSQVRTPLGAIKAVGDFTITIGLMTDITADVTVQVVAEE